MTADDTDGGVPDPRTVEAVRPWEEDGHTVTDFVVGPHHENHDGRKRGAYPKGLDPDDYTDTLRRFGAKTTQYLLVVGDLQGHAVYRMLNEGDSGQLHTMPWDAFIDRTVLVRPDAAGLRDQDDPARTVIRTDFDYLRASREQEVETGCSCVPPNEACGECGGEKEGHEA